MKSLKIISDSCYQFIAKKILIAYLALLLITTAMLVFAKRFHTETLIPHPQFGLNKERICALYSIASKSEAYCYFFYADMLFMLSIFILILYIFKLLKNTNGTKLYRSIIKNILIITGSLGILMDLLENYIYLKRDLNIFNCDLSWVETGKIISISMFLITFVHYFIFNIKSENWNKTIGFVKSSFISILILAIIGLGLTFMPQGATLIVHLLDETKGPGIINLVLTIILINTLAFILSHFPIYFAIAISDQKHKIKWHLNNIFMGLGIITYDYKGESDTWNKFARHSLGVLTYSTWFYVIYKAFDIYQLTNLNSFSATALFTIAILVLFAYFFNKTNYLKSDIKKEVGSIKFENAMKQFKKWSNYFLWSISITILYLTTWLLFLFCNEIGWSNLNLYLTIVFTILNIYTYILFRITKGMWIYAWGNTTTIQILETIDHKTTSHISSETHTYISFHNKKLSKFDPRSILLNIFSNIRYVNTIRWLGIFSLIILLISNFLLNWGYVTSMNAIVILLAFIINFYALITVVIKHFLFYKSLKYATIWEYVTKMNSTKAANFKKYFIPVVISLSLIFFILSNVFKSIDNIHQVNFEPYNDCITLSQFKDNLENQIDSNCVNKLVKIASFGGGLKSNLWTLLVMDRISTSFKEYNKNTVDTSFLNRCISLSGVSGGAVGLGNYLALDYLYRDNREIMRDKIEEIGLANIVSIDMAGIFLHDWLSNHVSHLKGMKTDRAKHAMNEYIDIIDTSKESIFNHSMREVWAKMYHKHGHIPALIINSASIGREPGVACSIHSFDTIFPGYIDFANPKNKKDLMYYDAISTSNRFPIMSPAAQVDCLGYFLDGGYFENSGLLTSSFFSKTLDKLSNKIDTISTLTINIINGKAAYINHFIIEQKIKIKTLNPSTNISAIIGGLADVDKLPHVLSEAEKVFKENGDSLFSIHLPHWITIEEIEKTLGGKIEISSALLDSIHYQNNKIDSALKYAYPTYNICWGVVEPPLARTLSRPAVEYQKAMIKYHVDCIKEIKEINEYLID